jgi:hypothetical protein
LAKCGSLLQPVDGFELDMLIEEFKDLQNDEILKYTNYPRIITSQIPHQTMFYTKPKKLSEVVKMHCGWYQYWKYY